jgi:hypothetical protein
MMLKSSPPKLEGEEMATRVTSSIKLKLSEAPEKFQSRWAKYPSEKSRFRSEAGLSNEAMGNLEKFLETKHDAKRNRYEFGSLS